MNKTAGTFAIIFIGAACFGAGQVRFVDGRLVRDSEATPEAVPQPPLRKAPSMDWDFREWEMPDSRKGALDAQISVADAEARELAGESLAEKLERISRQKFKELEEARPESKELLQEREPFANPDAGRQETPKGPEVLESLSEPHTQVFDSQLDRVDEAEIEELESEYEALRRRVMERQAAKKAAEAAAIKEAGPSGSEAEITPPPESMPPRVDGAVEETPNPAAADMESRRKLDERIRARLEGDVKEAEADVLEIKEEKLPNYYTYSGDCFNVLSSNYEARELGVSVAKSVEECFAAFFGGGTTFSRKVNLQMLTESEAKFDGHFQIIMDGSATISAKCVPDLPLDKFCGIAVDAYMGALAATLNGGPAKPPYWLVLAMRAALAQNIAAGVPYETARFAAANPPDSLADVIAYSKDSQKLADFMEISAYWNLVALRNISGGRENFERLMRAMLAGEDPAKLLESLKKRFGENFDLQLRSVMLGEIYARVGGVKNFEDSDRELVYLFTLQWQRDGEPPAPIADGGIFEERDGLSREIGQRISEIKLALPWANPVYYNAYVALGKMFMAAEDGDSDEFDACRKDFALELQKAREVAKKASEILAE